MNVYSHYYGATVERGIDVQAQSRELVNSPVSSMLRELSSMHALESSEHKGEMLSYLLRKENYSILGLSYLESPKTSGYSRSAPCGLQYVISVGSLTDIKEDLGRIVNFVTFQKPDSASPRAMDYFPMAESGYYYHNAPSVLAPIVDGLVRVSASQKNEVLLIALPKGKSENATARYTMAEALNCLPTRLRPNVRFFTGLPVAENVTDPLTGFSNAVDRFGANVVFCPNEYYQRIRTHHTCIAVDMDQASDAPAGAYARYMAGATDISMSLLSVTALLSGKQPLTPQSLNAAAERVELEGFSIPSPAETEGYRNQISKLKAENESLQRDIDCLLRQTPQVYPAYPQQYAGGGSRQLPASSGNAPSRKSGSSGSGGKSAKDTRSSPQQGPKSGNRKNADTDYAPVDWSPYPEEEAAPSGRRIPKWLMIVLAAIIIAALGVGAFFLAKTATDKIQNMDLPLDELSLPTESPLPSTEPPETGRMNDFFTLLLPSAGIRRT